MVLLLDLFIGSQLRDDLFLGVFWLSGLGQMSNGLLFQGDYLLPQLGHLLIELGVPLLKLIVLLLLLLFFFRKYPQGMLG